MLTFFSVLADDAVSEASQICCDKPKNQTECEHHIDK